VASIAEATRDSTKARSPLALHGVSAFLGHANVTTTARYLNVKDDYL